MKAVTTRSFEQDVLKSSTPVLVDFWADWCGPCKVLAPILDRVEAKLGDRVLIAKVDTEESKDLARKYGITGIPTLILFKNGVDIARFSGVRTEGFIIDTVNQNLTLAKD